MSANADQEQEIDREAALATLTPEERAAIEEEMSPEERAAMEELADDGDGEGGDEDEIKAENEGKSAGSDAESKSVATVEEPVENPVEKQFRPAYKADLPDGFDAQLAQLQEFDAALTAKFRAGECDVDEFLVEQKAIADARATAERLRTKAEISSEMAAQSTAQEWEHAVEQFIAHAKRIEGVDYHDKKLMKDLDLFVRNIANDPENAGRGFDFFLEEGHKRVKALHSIGGSQPQAKAPEEKPAKPAQRKPPVDKLPASLANVPGGDGPGDVADEFSDIDKLSGMEYERALAGMSKSQRDRYLASA